MVSKADRIKAIERVRNVMTPNPGSPPFHKTFKRKRAVYRALKRGDPEVVREYDYSVAINSLMGSIEKDLYGND